MFLSDPQLTGGPSTVAGEQPGAVRAFTTGLESAFEDTSIGAGVKALAAVGYRDDQVLDEKAYATSPFAREGGFQQGMTVAQAKVSAAKYDAEHAAAQTEGHPTASFLGGLAGGLMDPLYYIPYMDSMAPALKAAQVAKRGEVLGEASTQFLNAAIASTVEQPLIYAKDRAYGEDYDIRDAGSSVLLAALGGGAFGGLAAKMRLTFPQKVAGMQKALDDINMGREVDTQGAVNPVVSQDEGIRRALQAGQIPEPTPDMSPEALRAIQAAKEVSSGGASADDAAFLESYKNDGGESYYKDQISRLGDRTDVETRLRVDQMTPEEKTKALLTDELTGIPNRRAFQESERMPVQVSTDLDNFKAVNDEMTHLGGDSVLKNVAKVMQEEFEKVGGRVFRLGGDEFHGEAKTQAQADQAMKAARTRLDRAIIDVTLPDGTKLTKKGMGISYGTGQTRVEAEVGLKADKAAREQAGLRSARKPDVERVPPGAAEGQQDNAGARAAKLAYYRERLAAVTHRQPDWSPTGPTPDQTKVPDLSGLPLTDADKARLQTVDDQATKLEDMAKALKAGMSCYGL